MGKTRATSVDSANAPNMPSSIGPYQIEQLLGSGVMGDVYMAFDPRLKRHVAVKVLASQLSRDAQFVERFSTEAAAIGQLHHKNIVQIYFTGEDKGQYYFAMQFVNGGSLAELLEKESILLPQRALSIILQVLDGLAAAHATGMVHRDIKPANILLTKSGQALIADFGLVKSGGSSQTTVGVVLGTPDFLAPEQASGHAVDARTDLYAVGCVLYRMLSGQNPFRSDEPTGIIYQHLHQTPVPLTTLCHVPHELSEVVHRLLRKSPGDRFQTALEVRRILSKLVSLHSTSDESAVESQTHSSDILSAVECRNPINFDFLNANDGDLHKGGTPQHISDSVRRWVRRLTFRPDQGSQTQHLADDAIKIYQERCAELSQLIARSEDVCHELQQLANQHLEAAQSARQLRESATDPQVEQRWAKEQDARELDAKDLQERVAHQVEQLSHWRAAYAEAARTLESLNSHRGILLARLAVARSRTKMIRGPGPQRFLRKRWGQWGAAAGLLILVILIVNSFWSSAPATTSSVSSVDLEQHSAPVTRIPMATLEEVPVVYENGSRIRNSIGMELIQIPAGEFEMGSPIREVGRDPDEKQHHVRITQPFFMGVHEVTVGQFEQFVAATGYKTNAETDGKGGYGVYPGVGGGYEPRFTWRNGGFEQTNNHPVGNVTWYDANAFVRWLTEKEKVLYRLPTEAEAEYACRAGTQTIYQTGTNPTDLVKLANILDFTFRDNEVKKYQNDVSKLKNNPASDGFIFTAPVGSFEPNAFGLHDMVGNVDEWCSDWFDHNYFRNSPVNDPVGPESGVFRSFRGGFWGSIVQHTRSANRSRFEPDHRANYIGFRVVRSVTSDTHVVTAASPLPVDLSGPPPTDTVKFEGPPQTVVRVPAPIDDVVIGAGGNLLLLHLSKLRQLAVFDVKLAKVVKYIPLESNEISYAAGATKLFIGRKDEPLIQRWDLKTLELELTVDAPLGGVGKLAMGAESLTPLFLLANKEAKKSYVIDPVSMKAEPIQWEGWKGGAWGPVYINVSHDGSSVVVCGGGWAGLELAAIGDGKIQSQKTGGYCLDGALIAGNGVLVFPSKAPPFRADLTSTVPEFESVNFPAIDDSISISFAKRDGKAVLNVFGNIDTKRMFSIRDLSELNENTNLPIYKRVFLIPRARVLITIGKSSDELIVRPFDLVEALKAESVDYLFVNSAPRRSASRGEQYSYLIEVMSRKGDVRFALESGPPGMTLSSEGLLNWAVPVDFQPGDTAVIVKVVDKSQQELFHSFQLQVN